MKNLYFFLLLLIPLSLSAQKNAELWGAEISARYDRFDPLTNKGYYRIRLVVFASCYGDKPTTATIMATPYGGTGVSKDFTFTPSDTVSTNCCNGYGTQFCSDSIIGRYQAVRYVAEDTMMLDNSFCSYTFTWTGCCRTSLVTTGAAGTPMQINATASWCHSYNLEPVNTGRYFSTPQFAAAIGACNSLNTDYSDHDHGVDQYHFSLASPRVASDKAAPFHAPYSWQQPVMFSYDTSYPSPAHCVGMGIDVYNGTIRLNPAEPAITPVLVVTEKSKEGKLVARMEREMILNVDSFDKKHKPIITGINGTAQQVEYRHGNRCFWMKGFDLDPDDTVKMWATFEDPSAEISIEEGEKHPKLTFCWNAQWQHRRPEPYILDVWAEEVRSNSCVNTPPKRTNKKIYIYTMEPVTGIGDMQAQPDFQFYPNPTSGSLNVSWQGLPPQALVLLNALGQEVMSVSNPVAAPCSMDVSQLPKGIYHLRAVWQGQVVVKQVVVE